MPFSYSTIEVVLMKYFMLILFIIIFSLVNCEPHKDLKEIIEGHVISCDNVIKNEKCLENYVTEGQCEEPVSMCRVFIGFTHCQEFLRNCIKNIKESKKYCINFIKCVKEVYIISCMIRIHCTRIPYEFTTTDLCLQAKAICPNKTT